MKTNTVYLLFLMLLFNSCKSKLDRRNFLVVETGTITSSTTESVTLSSNILGFESGKIETYGYAYSAVSETPRLDTESTEYKMLGVRVEGGAFTSTIEGLVNNTTYYITAFALLDGALEAEYGEPVVFRTTDYALQVTTDSFNFKPGGYEVFGTVSNLAPGVVVKKYGFVWSTESDQPEVAIDNPSYLGSIADNTAFTKRFENVVPLKNYYVRAFAEIGTDIFYGETISFFKGDSWSEKGVQAGRDAVYFSVVNDKAYIGGGYNAGSKYDLQVYDPDPLVDSLDAWAYETPFDYLCNHGAAFTIEDTLYVVTGNDGVSTELWAYNTIDKSWFSRAPFPGGWRSFTLGHAVKGKGYIAMGKSGVGGTGSVLNELWRYDPVSNSWMEMPPFPEGGRTEPVVFATEDKLFIAFGRGHNNMYAFDVDLMNWEEEKAGISNDPFEGESFSTFRIGDKAYLLLGIPEDNFWEYDIPSDTWVKKSDFLGPKMDNPVFFAINGKGYIGMGGDGFSGIGFNMTMWEYTPDRR